MPMRSMARRADGVMKADLPIAQSILNARPLRDSHHPATDGQRRVAAFNVEVAHRLGFETFGSSWIRSRILSARRIDSGVAAIIAGSSRAHRSPAHTSPRRDGCALSPPEWRCSRSVVATREPIADSRAVSTPWSRTRAAFARSGAACRQIVVVAIAARCCSVCPAHRESTSAAIARRAVADLAQRAVRLRLSASPWSSRIKADAWQFHAAVRFKGGRRHFADRNIDAHDLAGKVRLEGEAAVTRTIRDRSESGLHWTIEDDGLDRPLGAPERHLPRGTDRHPSSTRLPFRSTGNSHRRRGAAPQRSADRVLPVPNS